ncbi:unnamed protein product [Camellia sinensis]
MFFSYGRFLCSAAELQSRPKLPTGATKSAAARGFHCYIVSHAKNGPSFTSPGPHVPGSFIQDPNNIAQLQKKPRLDNQAGRHYATAGSATTTAATGIHAITNPQSSVASFNSAAENATIAATVSAVYTTSAASPHTATIATAAAAAAAVETTTSTTGNATYRDAFRSRLGVGLFDRLMQLRSSTGSKGWSSIEVFDLRLDRLVRPEYYSPRAKKRWCLLEKLEPLEWDKVVHGHEAWRLITCIWLHAGILGLNSQQSNMLGSNSQLREMMQNPEFIRQLTSPETMQHESTHDFTANSFVSAWSATINPGSRSNRWGNRELQKSLEDCWCGTLDNMGSEMLMNMFGGLGIGSPAVPVRSDVPPEELYATQLSQLQEMGFFDARENIQALIAIAGNVHAAVERLLGNPAEAAKAQFSRDYSDNLALVRAYEAWKEVERDVAGYEYCWKNFLFAQLMKAIDGVLLFT